MKVLFPPDYGPGKGSLRRVDIHIMFYIAASVCFKKTEKFSEVKHLYPHDGNTSHCGMPCRCFGTRICPVERPCFSGQLRDEYLVLLGREELRTSQSMQRTGPSAVFPSKQQGDNIR